MSENETKPIPSVWQDSLMSVIYTLTHTHCGTGQAASSVDLPIARDVTTGFPVLPATSLKGVAREYFERQEVDSNLRDALFGPSLDQQETRADSSKALWASGLAFTEGRLAAYPARSLNRPFLHVTCPLIIENLLRDSRLLGQNRLPRPDVAWQDDRVYLADENLAGKTLVIEDLCYTEDETFFNPAVSAFAIALAGLLPGSEKETAARLAKGLVVLPDADFQDLLEWAVPVVARTLLTNGKTTDKWENPETGETESGNLWYEEYLPSDCLFISFIGQRRQVYMQNDTDNKQKRLLENPLGEFQKVWDRVPFIQIGGNETIGNGLCLWHTPNGGA